MTRKNGFFNIKTCETDTAKVSSNTIAHSSAPQMSRRGFLSRGTKMAIATPTLITGATLLTPTAGHAAIGGFCPPSSGGGSGNPGGGSAPGAEDYTGAIPGEGPPTRNVLLKNPRNGETFTENYVVDGQFVQSALENFNWFARDWRHNDPTNMDPGLLDIIYKLTQMLGTTTHWNMNSGYRNPASNATVGGAKQSYHMRGKALDVTNPQKSPGSVQSAARALAAGGVGTYNTFTHVDTGPFRTWGG